MTRSLLLAAAVLTAVAASAPAPARAYEAPWCAVINMGRGDAYWDCQYRTLEQCVPVILTGNRGFCNPNPAYVGPIPVPKRKIHHRRRARR